MRIEKVDTLVAPTLDAIERISEVSDVVDCRTNFLQPLCYLRATKKVIVETRQTLKGVRWEVTRTEWAERLRKIEEKLR